MDKLPENIIRVKDSKEKPVRKCSDCGADLEFALVEAKAVKYLNKGSPVVKLPEEDLWVGDCRKCKDNVLMKKIESQRAEDRMIKASKMVGDSMLTPRFKDRSFDEFEIYEGESENRMKEVLKACMDFARDFEKHLKRGTWLLMVGGTGTGKTLLCSAILNEVIRQGHKGLYVKVPRLFRKLRASFNKREGPTEDEIVSNIETADLVVMDEVGVNPDSNWSKIVFYDILDSRYENYKPTIFNTNLSFREACDTLGERIVDRFYQNGSKVLIFDWESYRRRMRR